VVVIIPPGNIVDEAFEAAITADDAVSNRADEVDDANNGAGGGEFHT
jgi:hypothetical protein